MANTLGLFDKQLVKVAWFDPTLQPGGWFSTDIVTTEGEAPTGVEATAALNEAADTGAAQVSVATHVTGVLVETGDSATAQASIAINAATATTEAPDTLSAQSGVSVGASSALTENADTVSSDGSVSVSVATVLSESADALVSAGAVIVAATASPVEASDTLTANSAVVSTVSVALGEAGDTLSALTSIPVQTSGALTENADSLASSALVQSPSVSATVTLNEDPDTLAAQVTADAVATVSATVVLAESSDVLSAVAAIGGELSDSWTAWGDSWGDSWGLSWGVFEQPYTELKPNLKLFVLAELSKVFVHSDVEQIIAVAEANNLSVLRAASALSMAVRVEGSRLLVAHQPLANRVAVLLPPNEVFAARSIPATGFKVDTLFGEARPHRSYPANGWMASVFGAPVARRKDVYSDRYLPCLTVYRPVQGVVVRQRAFSATVFEP